MKSSQCILFLLLTAALFFSFDRQRIYPSLYNSRDSALQSALEASLNQELEPGFIRAIEEKRAGIALVDITDPYHPKVAAIHGNKMMYAASLPKIAILLGVFVQVERGKMVLDDQIRKACVRMIRYSSNEDASMLLGYVGMENLAQILQSDRFRLYDRKHNGGLWIGRDYSDAPAWKRDPLHHISHGATAMQVARFYYLLFTGRLVSPELTKEMKKILSKPALDHKFVEGLEDKPNLKIYRKSGTWKNWHSDSGVILHKNFEYIIVALSKMRYGDERLSRLASAVDDLMKQRHNGS